MAMVAVAMTDGGGGKTKKLPAVSTIAAGVAVGAVKGAASVIAAKQAAKLVTKKVVTTTQKKATPVVTIKTTTQKKTTTTTTTTAKTTASTDIVKWSGGGGIAFFVKPKSVKGVKDINIKASVDTEDKENGGEKYTVKKNAGGLEITMTAVLNAMLGVNVESCAKAILEAARKGSSGYFYIAGKKLFTANFMMTDAEAQNVTLTGDGKWVSCEVTMTLKQCSKYDGTTTPATPSAPSTPSKPTTSTTTTTSSGTSIFQKVKDKVTQVVTGVKDAISKVAAALKTATTAKQQSQQVLKDSARSGGSGGGGGGGGGSTRFNMVK